MKKFVSFIATSAILLNSLVSPLSIFAQTSEPAPEEMNSDTLTTSPTDQPIATPTDLITTEVTPVPTPIDTIETTPPTEAPSVTQAPESNPTTPGPPEETTGNETLNETLIENVDLSKISGLNSNVLDSGAITTDKPDYSPGSVAVISGSGFLPNKSYSIEITADKGYSFVDHNIQADSDGNIQYLYTLDTAFHPLYTVNIKSGEVVVATLTFTDTSVTDYTQCQNDNNNDDIPNSCDWTTGALNQNNSILTEGNIVNHRLIQSGISGVGVHTFVFEYDFTKGGIHAYDFPSNFNGPPQGDSLLNPCGNLTGSDLTLCTNLFNGTGSAGTPILMDIPSDTTNGVNLREYPATRQWKINCSPACTSATVTSISSATGDTSSDSSKRITFQVTTTDPSTNVGVWMGMHLSSGPDPDGIGSAIGWGMNCGRNSNSSCGANGISGAPFHYKYISLDGNSVGARDNQIQPGAIVVQLTPTVSTVIHNPDHEIITTVPVETVVHDSVTVSGSGATPTGTITLNWYNNTSCSGTPAATSGDISLSSGTIDATGFTQTATITGGSFLAHYNGDSNYIAANGTCEPLIVTKFKPSISTTLSTTTATIGQLVYDTATLSGATTDAGGTVTYHAYAGANTCSGTDLFGLTGNVQTVTNGNVPNSGNISFNDAGTYSFQAVYSGDPNNEGDTSICSTEQLVVSQAQPKIITNATASVIVGEDIKDTATISDLVNPDGTAKITFHLYSNSGCTNQINTSQSDFVTVNGDYDSANYTTTATGTYYWIASFPGDSNNKAVSTSCGEQNESSVVNSASPTIETTQDPATAPLGTLLNDLATLANGYNPTGFITFDLYEPSDTDCENVIHTENIDVDGNGDYKTATGYTALIAGIWHWVASYTSDNNNNNNVSSPCDAEPVTVNTATLGITTEIRSASDDSVVAGHLPLGSGVYDTASVSGLVPGVTSPEVTFYFFDKGTTCVNGNITGGTKLNTVTPNSSGIAGPSTSKLNLPAGTHNFMAVVNDPNNNYVGATSNCEPFTIDRAQLTINTSVHDISHVDKTNQNVPLGSVMHDTATLSGGVQGFELPEVSFTLTNGYLGTCDTGTDVSLGGTGDPIRTVDSSALSAGDYAYRAVVASNDNYIGNSSSCEPFTVNKAQLRISTTVHDDNHNDITNDSLPFGSVVHDTAIVAGTVNGFEQPAVSFTLTNNFTESCSAGSPVDIGGIGDPLRTVDSPVLAAGTYAYRASVAGDNNYLGATSVCEPFTIFSKGISITKSNNKPSGASAGDTVVYTLTIANTGSIDVNNVIVTDILPGGFSFVDGSAKLNGSPITTTVTGSTLSWDIGTLSPGNPATITYQAIISSNASDGTYANFATCHGQILKEESIDCEIVNSTVQIGSSLSYGGNLGGQVLGISTVLPATGSPSWMLLGAITMIGTGFYLRKKYEKK